MNGGQHSLIAMLEAREEGLGQATRPVRNREAPVAEVT
jgi:hypothetical protein